MKTVISKEEVLGFIAYLQEKEEILIESQLVKKRTMMRAYSADLKDEAYMIAKIIKAAPSPLEAYKRVAHIKARKNANWRGVSAVGYLFSEDVDEWARAYGVNGDEFAHYALYGSKELEEKYRKVLPKEVMDWARGTVNLESRMIFKNLFPTEYINFCHHTFEYHDEKYSCHETKCIGRYGDIIFAFGNEVDNDTVVIAAKAFNDNPAMMNAFAKFMCEQLGMKKAIITDCVNVYATIVQKVSE